MFKAECGTPVTFVYNDGEERPGILIANDHSYNKSLVFLPGDRDCGHVNCLVTCVSKIAEADVCSICGTKLGENKRVYSKVDGSFVHLTDQDTEMIRSLFVGCKGKAT